jgi:hypothetical protein
MKIEVTLANILSKVSVIGSKNGQMYLRFHNLKDYL